ncbi:non-ribosomal peptide synthetase, partial [Streptomyces sp. CB01881]
ALSGSPEQPIVLPAKTTSFRDWARHLHDHAQTEEIGAQTEHWLETLRAGEESGVLLDLLPDDDETLESVNTRASACSVTVALEAEQTKLLLQEAPSAYQARIEELLLTATGLALTDALGERQVLVELEGHGREDLGPQLDLSRTVGWFTSAYPVLLDIAPGASVAGALRQVREQRRRVPGDGLGYGLLRHLRTGDPLAAELAELPAAAVCFNYLGQLDQSFQPGGLWEPASENPGPGLDARATRSHLIEVNALVLGEELRFTWTYSDRLYREETIAGLAEHCLGTLRALIAGRPAAGDGNRGADSGSVPGPRELSELLGRFDA